jgi:hypothetical protein
LAFKIGIGNRRSLDPSSGTARQLPRRIHRPADDRRDLVEWHSEHVVQHECHSLGGVKAVEDGQEGQAERVSKQRLLLRVQAGFRTDDRIRHMRIKGRLATHPSRAKHVQGHTGDDRGQPAAHVLDVAGVGPAELDP